MESSERQDGFLDRNGTARRQGTPITLTGKQALVAKFLDGRTRHDSSRRLRHGNTGGFGDERHCPRSSGVGFQDVERVLGKSELHVQQAPHPHALRDGTCRRSDAVDVRFPEGHGWQSTRRVTRVDARLFDVLHDAGEIHVVAIKERINIDFYRVIKEAVHQHRMFTGHLGRPLQVTLEHRIVVHNLHPSPAEHITRANEYRVPNASRDGRCLVEGPRRSVVGSRQSSVRQHAAEGSSLFGEMDGGRRGAHNRDACIFEALRQSEWCLATELDDDANDGSLSLLGIDNFQDVFARQGFEIETIGGVVVRGDGFRVAIDHDRFETGVGERQCSMDARVVELDALTDAIRAGSEDDHLLAT